MTIKSPTARPASTSRAKAVPTKVSKVKATAAPQHSPEAAETLAADLNSLFAKHKLAIPNTARWVISIIVGLLAAGVVSYLGSVTLVLAINAALFYTGSALVAMLVYVLGLLAVFYASWVAGGSVTGFLLSRKADRCYQYTSNSISSGVATVRGWFGTSKAVHA